MVFSSFVFLFFFLPVVVLGYYLSPKSLKNMWLLLASLFFYAWGEPKYILIMLFSTFFDYTNGQLIRRWREHKLLPRLVLILSLVVNLGLLIFFKYSSFPLPIGISFYTFQTLSYTIDVYRDKVKVQENIIDFGMYICLFPQLVAGPIVRYAEIEKEIKNRKTDIDLIWHGIFRFVIGLGKKVILANQIGSLWEELLQRASSLTVLEAWIGAFAFAFQIYFDFSGYSDMAIGLGEIFGFHFPENFNYPYLAKSITDFWRRWHMTLSGWFREYVYIPLGGNRKGTVRMVFNLFVVWLLTGMWHGATFNFAMWGLYYFVLLTVEKLWLLKWIEKWPVTFQRLYSIFFILIGWVIFACDKKDVLITYALNLFGKNGMANSMGFYYLRSYGFLFLVLCIASTTLGKSLFKKLEDNKKAYLSLQVVTMVVVCGLSICFLVADSYNPFLYFRF